MNPVTKASGSKIALRCADTSASEPVSARSAAAIAQVIGIRSASDASATALAALRVHPHFADFRKRFIWRCDAAGAPDASGTHVYIRAEALKGEKTDLRLAAASKAQLRLVAQVMGGDYVDRTFCQAFFLESLKALSFRRVSGILCDIRMCGSATARQNPFKQGNADVLCYQLLFFLKQLSPQDKQMSSRQLEQLERRYAENSRRGKEILHMAYASALPPAAR